MATHRVKYVKLDANIRLPGLESRNYFRAPQIQDNGEFAALDDVGLTFNDATGMIRIHRRANDGRERVSLVHASRAWNIDLLGDAEAKLVDEAMSRRKEALDARAVEREAETVKLGRKSA